MLSHARGVESDLSKGCDDVMISEQPEVKHEHGKEQAVVASHSVAREKGSCRSPKDEAGIKGSTSKPEPSRRRNRCHSRVILSRLAWRPPAGWSPPATLGYRKWSRDGARPAAIIAPLRSEM
jgi:hypothetical protein